MAYKVGKVCLFKHLKQLLQNFEKLLILSKQFLVVFHQSGKLARWTNSAFSSFCFRAFKSLQFCQKKSLVVFHQVDGLRFWVFEVSKLSKSLTFVNRSVWVVFRQASDLQNEQSLRFQVFETSKLSKFIIFVKRGAWLVFHQAGGLQNEKNLFFKTNVSKHGGWVSYTFVQKPGSFKRFKHFRRKLWCRHQKWNI